MRFVVIVLLALSGGLVAQVERTRECLGAVRKYQAARDVLGAARSLREADMYLGVVPAGVERVDLEAEIAKLVLVVDPLLPRRRELERELGGAFVAMSRVMLEAGYPRTAELMAVDAARFDAVVAGEQLQVAKVAVAANDLSTDQGRLDVSFDVWFKTMRLLKLDKDGKQVKKVVVPKRFAGLRSKIRRWFDARGKAARRMRALAGAYKSKGRIELAFELVGVAFALDRDASEKSYDKLRVAAADQRAERRFDRLSKVHMEELRGNNRKLGGSKGWRVGPRVIEAPKASTKTAILVSNRKLTGDYRIEADLLFENILGVLQVVLAWRSSEDYCVLEFERARASYSNLRIVHIVKGSHNVLVTTRARQTMRDYFTVVGEVKGGRIKVSLGSASCLADSPIDTSKGVSFGFARPALDRKPKRAQKNAAVRIRNLVIVEL